jgi:hypothetical protein
VEHNFIFINIPCFCQVTPQECQGFGHKEKANQNRNYDSTLLLLERLPSKTQTTTNVGEDNGKKEISYTAGGNVN